MFLLLLFTSLFPSCQSQNPTVIRGHVKVTQDWKPIIYLVMPRHFGEIAADYQGQVLDSAAIDAEGNFRFHNSQLPAGRTLFQLVLQRHHSKYANHLEDENPAEANYMSIIYSPGESIEMEADANAFHRTFSFIEPTEENQSLIALRNIRMVAFEKYTDASGTLEEDSLLIEKEKAFRDYIGRLMHFADTTSVPEAALLAIRWISPTNDFERIPEFIAGQCAKWETSDDASFQCSGTLQDSGPESVARHDGRHVSGFPVAHVHRRHGSFAHPSRKKNNHHRPVGLLVRTMQERKPRSSDSAFSKISGGGIANHQLFPRRGGWCLALCDPQG